MRIEHMAFSGRVGAVGAAGQQPGAATGVRCAGTDKRFGNGCDVSHGAAAPPLSTEMLTSKGLWTAPAIRYSDLRNNSDTISRRLKSHRNDAKSSASRIQPAAGSRPEGYNMSA